MLRLHYPAKKVSRGWEKSRPVCLFGGLVGSVNAAEGLAPSFDVGLLRGCCSAVCSHLALLQIRTRVAAAAVELACDGLLACAVVGALHLAHHEH